VVLRTSTFSESQILGLLNDADASLSRATQTGAGRDAQNNIRLRMNFQIEIWGYWPKSPRRGLDSRLHIAG